MHEACGNRRRSASVVGQYCSSTNPRSAGLALTSACKATVASTATATCLTRKAAQPLETVSPVRRRLARRPPTSGRGRPAPAPAGTTTDHGDISRFASAMPKVERPKDGRGAGSATWLQIGRRAHPAPPARRSARPRSGAAILAVIGRSSSRTSPERGRSGDVALPSPRRLSAANMGRRARRRCRRAPWRESFCHSRGHRATQAGGERPAEPPGVANLRLAQPAKPPSCHPG